MAKQEPRGPLIREARPQDRDAIQALVSLAFAGPEGESVPKLAVELLDEAGDPPTLSLVAEADGRLVGHVAFSPIGLSAAEGLRGYLLAPLGVRPGVQKQGIGSRLVEVGLGRLRESGVDFVMVYGDPTYYRRFGFTADAAEPFAPPYKLEHPFGWLATPITKELPAGSVRVACVGPLCDPKLW